MNRRWHVQVRYEDGVESVFEYTSAFNGPYPHLEEIGGMLRPAKITKIELTDVASLPTLGPIGTNG